MITVPAMGRLGALEPIIAKRLTRKSIMLDVIDGFEQKDANECCCQIECQRQPPKGETDAKTKKDLHHLIKQHFILPPSPTLLMLFAGSNAPGASVDS